MLSGRYDLLILDEIFVAIQKGLITTEQVLDLLEKKPESVELILTGRYAPAKVVERADLVTEMRMIKHPFNQGIAARCGIEY
jgi:cob(I)alamin adenosyltransferase